MAIEVDLSNPPPWVVHVSFLEDGEEIPVTWPFEDEKMARVAYEMAVKSGQFTRCIRKATRKEPEITTTLVSLWRLMVGTNIKGEPHIWYRAVVGPNEQEYSVIKSQQTEGENDGTANQD